MSMVSVVGRAITASGESQNSPLKRGGVPGMSIIASGRPFVRSARPPSCFEHHDARAAADVVIENAAVVLNVER